MTNAGPTGSCIALWAIFSSACVAPAPATLSFSGSSVGREGEVIRLQLQRFQQAHPTLNVVLRPTPDAADQRHQLYVQWLNARSVDPDVLQLDVVWTPEFAAAGWIASLDRFHPSTDSFFAAALTADRWNGALYSLPWFVDVGMLYRRTDVVPRAPRDLRDLIQLAEQAQRQHAIPFGLVWQGARYEGLVTVFLEYLGAFGGEILDAERRVRVDSPAAQQALTFMRDSIYVDHVVPPAVLTWQEEQTRFAFESGQAVFMRNWPYAYGLLNDHSHSRVAEQFAVSTMPPAAAGGNSGAATAALGGSVLAINAFSDQPEAAYALLDYLLQPEQMLERARIVGEYPTRPALYRTRALAEALDVPLDDVLAIVTRATPRPVTPVYSELSDILQIALHRVLTRQQEPAPALRDAADAIRTLLVKAKLGPPTP
jgi:multiple sugar transport system substrate-binding protein